MYGIRSFMKNQSPTCDCGGMSDSELPYLLILLFLNSDCSVFLSFNYSIYSL